MRLNNRYTGNWTSLENLTSHTQKIVVRADEVLTPNDRFSFNVYRYTNTSPQYVSYDNPLLNTNYDCSCTNAWLPSVDYTRI